MTDKIVFDVPGAELGHHGEVLRLLAEIVRAADSQPRNPHPAGEGLRRIAHGFAAMGPPDQEILKREFIVYDALYAECQRRAGTGK